MNPPIILTTLHRGKKPMFLVFSCGSSSMKQKFTNSLTHSLTHSLTNKHLAKIYTTGQKWTEVDKGGH